MMSVLFLVEPAKKPNVYLSNCLFSHIGIWSSQLYHCFSYYDILFSEVKVILQQSSSCGFIFLRKTCSIFYQKLISIPISFSPYHPQQGLNQSYTDYCNAVEFHYNFVTLIDDLHVQYDKKYVQDQFVHLYSIQIKSWIKLA